MVEGDIKITIIPTIYFSAKLWKWYENMVFKIIFTKI